MPIEYQLQLLNVTPRIRWNTLLGVLGIGALGCAVYVLLHRLYPKGGSAIAGAMLVVAASFLVGIFSYHKAVMVPSLLSITDTQLSVRDLRRDQLTLCVAYATIAAYRHQTTGGGTEELRLTLHTGERLYLKSAANLDLTGKFTKMVQEFERQLGALPASASPTKDNSSPELAQREKSFLEKPVATGLLLAAIAGLGLLGWQVAVGHLTVGNVAGVGGVCLSYLVAWLAARRPKA